MYLPVSLLTRPVGARCEGAYLSLHFPYNGGVPVSHLFPMLLNNLCSYILVWVVSGLNKSPTMTADPPFIWMYCVTRQRDGQEKTVLVWNASFIPEVWEDAFRVPRVMAKFSVPSTQIIIPERSGSWFLSWVFPFVSSPSLLLGSGFPVFQEA